MWQSAKRNTRGFFRGYFFAFHACVLRVIFCSVKSPVLQAERVLPITELALSTVCIIGSHSTMEHHQSVHFSNERKMSAGCHRLGGPYRVWGGIFLRQSS